MASSKKTISTAIKNDDRHGGCMRKWEQSLLEGQVIPACPLALTSAGDWCSRYQKALIRYYLAAGAGGLAVGVHTTQFEMRDHGLYEPVLKAVSDVLNQSQSIDSGFIRVAGLCGSRGQTLEEARLSHDMGYHLGLLSPSGLKDLTEGDLIQHTKEVAQIMPVFGFYLQPAVGGRTLSFDYWRRLVQIDNLKAIKIAAFDRYQTIEVLRAVEESNRLDLAIYTGNDDNIIADLVAPINLRETKPTRWMSGGLLGQWAVWTRQAVRLLEEIKESRQNEKVDRRFLFENLRLTDVNSALFDAKNGFKGCIAGINEVLYRQGLLPSSRCLNDSETLSSGQSEEIDRVYDYGAEENRWIQENVQRWLRD